LRLGETPGHNPDCGHRSAMKTFAITHPGLARENNEDRCLSMELDGGPVLLALADGMGGEARGGLDNIAIVGLQP
jgi:serine/threonine protein phosphatase PrpC